jgi:hypothetical protein
MKPSGSDAPARGKHTKEDGLLPSLASLFHETREQRKLFILSCNDPSAFALIV